MNILYAPWRSKYAKSINKTKKEICTENTCVFCQHFSEKNDATNFILKRYKNSIVMLNLYPYNAGHLLVIPKKHKPDLDKLTKEERSELMEVVNTCTKILKKVLQPEGFNIGMNLGKLAGAGIPSHLHIHILPRWLGDTNFLPLLAETKQISFDLKDIYTKLKKEFSK